MKKIIILLIFFIFIKNNLYSITNTQTNKYLFCPKTIKYTFFSSGGTAAGMMLGYFYKKRAENIYETYSSASSSSTAEHLGTKMETCYSLSSGFFYIAESSLLLTLLFGSDVVIKYMRYKHKSILPNLQQHLLFKNEEFQYYVICYF